MLPPSGIVLQTLTTDLLFYLDSLVLTKYDCTRKKPINYVCFRKDVLVFARWLPSFHSFRLILKRVIGVYSADNRAEKDEIIGVNASARPVRCSMKTTHTITIHEYMYIVNEKTVKK